MFAKLKGKIDEVLNNNYIIVDVDGVGYGVEALGSYLEGTEVSLYIYTHVRENEIKLFGFQAKDQYNLFMDLINISGIGPKSAIVILDKLSVDEILNSVEKKDAKSLAVKGVGKKTAERIIVEMSNKLDKYHYNALINKYSIDFEKEALGALINLGFDRSEIKNILENYKNTEGEDNIAHLVKFALKYINS